MARPQRKQALKAKERIHQLYSSPTKQMNQDDNKKDESLLLCNEELLAHDNEAPSHKDKNDWFTSVDTNKRTCTSSSYMEGIEYSMVTNLSNEIQDLIFGATKREPQGLACAPGPQQPKHLSKERHLKFASIKPLVPSFDDSSDEELPLKLQPKFKYMRPVTPEDHQLGPTPVQGKKELTPSSTAVKGKTVTPSLSESTGNKKQKRNVSATENSVPATKVASAKTRTTKTGASSITKRTPARPRTAPGRISSASARKPKPVQRRKTTTSVQGRPTKQAPQVLQIHPIPSMVFPMLPPQYMYEIPFQYIRGATPHQRMHAGPRHHMQAMPYHNMHAMTHHDMQVMPSQPMLVVQQANMSMHNTAATPAPSLVRNTSGMGAGATFLTATSPPPQVWREESGENPFQVQQGKLTPQSFFGTQHVPGRPSSFESQKSARQVLFVSQQVQRQTQLVPPQTTFGAQHAPHQASWPQESALQASFGSPKEVAPRALFGSQDLVRQPSYGSPNGFPGHQGSGGSLGRSPVHFTGRQGFGGSLGRSPDRLFDDGLSLDGDLHDDASFGLINARDLIGTGSAASMVERNSDGSNIPSEIAMSPESPYTPRTHQLPWFPAQGSLNTAIEPMRDTSTEGYNYNYTVSETRTESASGKVSGGTNAQPRRVSMPNNQWTSPAGPSREGSPEAAMEATAAAASQQTPARYGRRTRASLIDEESEEDPLARCQEDFLVNPMELPHIPPPLLDRESSANLFNGTPWLSRRRVQNLQGDDDFGGLLSHIMPVPSPNGPLHHNSI